ncbi:MAG: hypothetical protein U0797_28975 [Gemmataceae bacterium]
MGSSFCTLRFVLFSSFILHPSSFLRADGGLLRLSERGVSVFTSPTPPRVGTLDVSVLVQDAKGKVRLGVPVRVRAWPVEDTDHVVEADATTELATNKLLQSAHLELDRPGPWRLVVEVGSTEFACDFEVAGPSPSWWPLAPWVGWPFLVVALFFLRFFLARREPPPNRGV